MLIALSVFLVALVALVVWFVRRSRAEAVSEFSFGLRPDERRSVACIVRGYVATVAEYDAIVSDFANPCALFNGVADRCEAGLVALVSIEAPGRNVFYAAPCGFGYVRNLYLPDGETPDWHPNKAIYTASAERLVEDRTGHVRVVFVAHKPSDWLEAMRMWAAAEKPPKGPPTGPVLAMAMLAMVMGCTFLRGLVMDVSSGVPSRSGCVPLTGRCNGKVPEHCSASGRWWAAIPPFPDGGQRACAEGCAVFPLDGGSVAACVRDAGMRASDVVDVTSDVVDVASDVVDAEEVQP